MSFFETPRFPDYLAYGLLVGPAFLTDVIRIGTGQESLNQRWEQPLLSFDGSTTHRTHAERNEINQFFVAIAKGRANSFRLRDVTDYADDGAGFLTVLSSSPSNEYQMVKRYTSGVTTFDRNIRKPVSGLVSITGGGSYSVDYTTGVVTHTAGSPPTGWTGQFDVPVRFDHDTMQWEVAARAPSASSYLYVAREMRLIEVRV